MTTTKTTTTTTKTTRYAYAIVYVGAPYGLGEDGHIVSRHTSLETAERAFEARFAGNSRNNIICPLHADGGWSRSERVSSR